MTIRIEAETLTEAVTGIFTAAGIEADAARIVAADLVQADLEGLGSHGVMRVPMYVERIQKGSVSRASRGEVVHSDRAALVIDAGNALGQLVAHQAVEAVIERAREYGMATAAVRNGFHFGAAGHYAARIAGQGCAGIVMSNTRPMLPATGGAQPITGNNPIAIALPSADGVPVKVDMALSAVAMGKIQLAGAAGQGIPEGWAMAADGQPTTDPDEAMRGMLAPAAGPKGFGLAFIIDLLCGGLSGGAIGGEVTPLYGDLAEPYRCSQLFMAIDVSAFGLSQTFAQRVQEQAQRVRDSRRAPGVDRIYAPGERSHATRMKNAGVCTISPPTLTSLIATANSVGAGAAGRALARSTA